MRIRLKGICKVTAKGHTYHYAWRGPPLGPRLPGKPGSPEFMAAYNEAIAGRNAPDTSRFRGVVEAYRRSPDWRNLAPSTKKTWTPWLDRISDYFGDLRIEQFNRTEKIQPIIRRWRYDWAETPRTADHGLQCLSRLCSFAIDPLGKIGRNPCEGIKRLYEGSDRADIIWTASDIESLRKSAAPEIMHAVDLAAHTGLRLSDLIRVSWSHVRDHAIVLPTGKSRGRLEVIIPLYPALRTVLDAIPKRATTILTSAAARPWTVDSLDKAVRRAKRKAGVSDDLHFHDLRGSAATRLYVAGIEERVIAETLGWTRDSVRRIIRKYVGSDAATADFVRKLSEQR
jgi:integrase